MSTPNSMLELLSRSSELEVRLERIEFALETLSIEELLTCDDPILQLIGKRLQSVRDASSSR